MHSSKFGGIVNKLLDIVSALDVIAFEPKDDHVFIAISKVNAWFTDLYRHCYLEGSLLTDTDAYELPLAFPFVDHFLYEANILWKANKDGQCKSGIWTEDGKAGPCMLEAIAVQSEGQSYLLLTNHTETFSQRQQVYQKAREIALTNEKLIVELNHRQRSLQAQIESHLKHEASLSAISQSIDSNSSAVMICQPDGSIEVFNKALIDIYQIEEDDRLRRSSLLDRWLKEAEQTYPEIKRVVQSGLRWEGEFESLDSTGNSKWIRLAIGPVHDKKGYVNHYVCVANDLSEYLHISNSESGSVSEYDFTTHLPNRRYFWRKITSCIDNNEAPTLLYIDIDFFKTVNEKVGHEAGDKLLGAMASRISRSVKRTDFVAHLGGDEFVVIIKGDNVTDNLPTICDRILGNIREPLTLLNDTICVTASIGYAERKQNETASELLKHADTAMFAAKELGRDHARCYSPDLDRRLNAFHHREYEIRQGIEQKEFELYFQPQVSMTTNLGFRLEVLTRWNHPERGLVSPVDFIPVAESSGLIVPLGEWILRTACLQGNSLLSENIPANIAVNISAKQLKHPAFYEMLTKVLEETGYPRERLELEITESAFLDDMDKAIQLLDRIRLLGVSLSLDDFGSGFSSLNYLRRLPVDYLKIDRSFIQELPSDRESQIITSSVISLAHTLEKRVIAEGVETEGQLNFLNQKGCDYIQGFYFYKPLRYEQLSDVYKGFTDKAHGKK